MYAYLLMVVFAFTGLAESVLIKQYNKKYDKGGFVFTALVSVFGLVYMIGSNLVAGKGVHFTPELIIYAVIGGILYCSASICTFIALRTGPFAITMLVLSYSLVFSILYGLVFLHDPATPFTYIGLLMIAASIFLFKASPKKDKEEEVAEEAEPVLPEKKKFSWVWLITMIVSVVGAGMFSVIQKMQQVEFDKAYDNEFMMITYALTAVSLLIIGFARDGKDSFKIIKNGVPYAGLAGIANGATNMIGMVTNALIAVSIAVPTRSVIKTLVTFLVSLLIFKEKFTLKQIIGVILGAAAIVIIRF